MMQRYAWCSDIHLDHIDVDSKLIEFAESLLVKNPAGIIITGDVSNAQRLVYHLSVIERVAQRPVYFVCGNHDYYSSEVAEVRKQIKEACNLSTHLKYLSASSYVVLSQDTALVGHDGWYDGLNGNASGSKFMMTDWVLIKDFLQASGGKNFIGMKGDVRDRRALLDVAQSLASDGAQHVAAGIKGAVRYHKNVIVATHVPPFQESHIYQGAVGDASAQPWFTSRMMGDVLLSAARSFPHVMFTCLAGHTHGLYDGKPLPNLRVRVAGAEYGRPGLAAMIDVA